MLVAGLRSGGEVVQDTWLAVIRGADGFHGHSSLRTRVYRILVSTAKKRGVKEKRTVPWTSLDPDGGPTVDPDRFRGPDDAYPGHWREFPEPWVLGDEFRHVVARALVRGGVRDAGDLGEPGLERVSGVARPVAQPVAVPRSGAGSPPR
ncbi:hypothetical protein Lesp02_15390 [Lentzea sp. NBRC 105346]|uniref:hypothetical protein n=1 Tax=Lentzea sp. NBRC 105346 TaxID=3032205 RepID=UPI0024A56084|nr:hypothetical protein [Lentzea sp. NBRC 105346]GLZ29349.1 hypothetical protein Lesp02_15390 [Lentzea sp. NBRC 105346]